MADEGRPREEPVPAGMTATPGAFECARCGYRYEVTRLANLPVCPECLGEYWWPGSGQTTMYHGAGRKG